MKSNRLRAIFLGLSALLFACSSPQESEAPAETPEAAAPEAVAEPAAEAQPVEEVAEAQPVEEVVEEVVEVPIVEPAPPTAAEAEAPVAVAEVPAIEVASAGLAAMLPADTVFYVDIPDVQAMRASIKGSALGQIFWHEDMQAFLAGGMQMLSEGWDTMRPMMVEQTGMPEDAMYWDALESVEAGVAMRARAGLENPFDEDPEVYLVARVGMKEGLALAMMDAMSPTLEMTDGFQLVETATGTVFEMRPAGWDAEGPLATLRVADDAVLFELKMGARGAGSLAAVPAFLSARERVGADGAAVFAYADFNDLWNTLMAGLGHQEPEFAGVLHYVMDPIMSPMQSIAMASGWDDGVSFTNLSVDLAEDAGPLWQSGPADLSLLDYVPADATSFSVGDFSSANAWAAHFLGAVDMLGGMEVEEGMTLSQMTAVEIPEAHDWLFGDQRPELDAALSSFGTRTFSYGRTTGLSSEDMMLTEVRDAAAVSNALEKLMPRLREALQLADAPFQLDLKRVRKRVEGPDGQMQTVAGPAYYSLNLSASMPQEMSMFGLNLQPTIGVTEDGWMVFSMARGPVRKALSDGVQKPEESIRGNVEVEAFLARAGDGNSALTWNDPRPPMESMIGMALGLAPMAAQVVTDSGLPFDLNELPGVDVFVGPLRPTETVTRMVGGDLVAMVRGSFGFADIFSLCGAVVSVAPVGMMTTVDSMQMEPAGGGELEEF